MQNDLEFLRIRSMKQEIMVAPRKYDALQLDIAGRFCL